MIDLIYTNAYCYYRNEYIPHTCYDNHIRNYQGFLNVLANEMVHNTIDSKIVDRHCLHMMQADENLLREHSITSIIR